MPTRVVTRSQWRGPRRRFLPSLGAAVYTLSGSGTIPAPAGSGTGLTFVAPVYTLSGGGTVPVPAGSGTGLTYVSASTLSGSATLDPPTGSGTGLTFSSGGFTLSGAGTLPVPVGSGTGLTFVAPVYTLSGNGGVPVPVGSGTGLTYVSASVLSGGGTIPVPSGSGTGLTFVGTAFTLSGSGTVPVPAGSGLGLRAYVSRTGSLLVSAAGVAGASGGFTDGSPKQSVRTSTDVLYVVAADGPALDLVGNKLHVYKAGNSGIPTSFSKLSLTEPTEIVAVAAAIDRTDIIHIAWRDRSGNGTVKYATLNTATDTLSASTTVDTSASASGNNGQGYEGIALALDSTGTPHIAYLYHDGTKLRAAYRNRTGGSWSSRTLVDNNTYGSNERAWHPNLAIDASDRILFGWAAGTFNETQNNSAFTRVSTDGGGTFGTRVTLGTIWVSIDTSLVFYLDLAGRWHASFAESVNVANVYSERVRYYYSDDQGASWTANHPESGGAATHNPHVGPGVRGAVRIYGHGAQNTSDHGNDITYWEGAGGGGTWSVRQTFVAGSNFDSSVNARWATVTAWYPNTIDILYWDDNYGNDLYYGGERIIPDGVLGQGGSGTIPVPTGGGTGLQYAAGLVILSGGGTIPVPTGSGAGIQYTNPVYTLSGNGTLGVPSGSGTGLTYVGLGTLSGGATVPLVAGSGIGLSYKSNSTLSGTGSVPVMAGSGAGIQFVAPVYTISGSGSVPVPSGSGTGLLFAELGFVAITNPSGAWGDETRADWDESALVGAWGAERRGRWG